MNQPRTLAVRAEATITFTATVEDGSEAAALTNQEIADRFREIFRDIIGDSTDEAEAEDALHDVDIHVHVTAKEKP